MADYEELPRAFSPAMRRVDPILEREDDNAIFAALRRRDLRRWGARWKGSFLQFFGIAVLCPIVIWLGLARGPKLGEVVAGGVLTLAAAGLLAGNFLLGRTRRLVALGAGTVRLDDGRRAHAQDLWMAGATGRMIIEAMYLEGALRRPVAALVAALAMLGLQVAVGAMLLASRPPWYPAEKWFVVTPTEGAMFAVASLAFLWRGWLGISVLMAWLQIALLEVQVDFWRTPPRRGRRLRMMTQAWLAAVPYAVVCVLFLLPLAVAVAYILSMFNPGAPQRQPILPMGWVLLPLWLCLLSVVLSAMSTRALCGARWENLMASADKAFELFFRETLMGDTPPKEDLPPPFRPEEMRRDPMLQAAEHNGMFEALRLRDEWHGRAARKRARQRAMACWAGGICLFVFLYINLASAWALVPTAIAMLVVATVAAIVSLTRTPTPLGAIAFPSMGGEAPRAREWLQEFWLAGATGRYVAEAEYLALARRFRGAEVAQAALVAMIPLAAVLQRITRLDLLAFWGMTALAMIWLARPALLQLHRGLRLRVIRNRVAEWRGVDGSLGGLIAECLPLAIVCIVLAGVPAYFLTVPDTLAYSYGSRLEAQRVLWLQAMGLSVIVGMVLRGLAGVWQRRNARLWEQIASEADATLPGYFARSAMGDPDG